MRLFGLQNGPLVMVAVLFVSSALLRVGLNADTALASVPTQQSEALENCDASPDLSLALDVVQNRQAELNQRESRLNEQQAALEQSKIDLKQHIQDLQSAEEALSATLSQAQTAAQSDLEQLSQVYMAMKPKQAAAVFEEMDPQFASGFMSMMTAESAAKIMAGMSPEKAYALSAILAGRNANAPTQ